jgi:hypothetical protein
MIKSPASLKLAVLDPEVARDSRVIAAGRSPPLKGSTVVGLALLPEPRPKARNLPTR